MTVMVECAQCRRRQSLKHQKARQCIQCDGKLSGSETYWVFYRLRHQIWEGPFAKAKDAAARDGKIKSEKQSGRIGDKTEYSWRVRDLTGWFLELKHIKVLRSYDRVVNAIKNVDRLLGDKKLTDLGTTDLRGYQTEREHEGAAYGTIDQELGHLKAAARTAWHDDKITDRPVKAFGNCKRLLRGHDNARDQVFTAEELSSLLDAASGHFRRILITEIYTGCRANELMSLRWDMIDSAKTWITLPKEVCKEGHHRQNYTKRIPIAPAAREALRGILAYNMKMGYRPDVVFHFNNRPYGRSFSNAMRRAMKRVGLVYGRESGRTFHDLRRTVKSLMAEAGLSSEIRNKICGHAERGMDAFYLQVSDERLLEGMAQYASFLDAKLKNASEIAKPTGSDGAIPAVTPQITSEYANG
jgi:integrase